MHQTLKTTLAELLHRRAHPITGSRKDHDPLLDLCTNARVILLGEASHGTHEFYRERSRITRRLINEQGFDAVAVEADWPDAYRVNRWVQGAGEDRSALDSLGSFERFPGWMWRNRDVLEFITWLHDYNREHVRNVGFYGLDLYSLFTSMQEVVRFLEQVDPAAAARARYRYSCFDAFAEDSQAYGYAAEFDLSRSCEDQAVQQLVELQRRAPEQGRREDGGLPEDDLFEAEQNARLVKNAEEYYRTMFRGRVSSWNLRDQHMAETLEALLAHLDQRTGHGSRVVVWEHNSHIGDARATSMGEMGEWNVGQLVRERRGEHAVLIGFSTYTGTVTAASDWDAPAQLKRVRPALPGSFETLFHGLEMDNFLLPMRGDPELQDALDDIRLERAIGVIYRPESERVSHYFEARLPQQFDAVLHFDVTQAVEPLDRAAGWDQGEPPETFPTGL
jgi:erythromycin esterase-like protein